MDAHLAFVAGEENNKLALLDLTNGQVLATYPVGKDPDVLAFDPGLKLLYVSAESGTVTVFRENGKALVTLGSLHAARPYGLGRSRHSPGLFSAAESEWPPGAAYHGADSVKLTAYASSEGPGRDNTHRSQAQNLC